MSGCFRWVIRDTFFKVMVGIGNPTAAALLFMRGLFQTVHSIIRKAIQLLSIRSLLPCPFTDIPVVASGCTGLRVFVMQLHLEWNAFLACQPTTNVVLQSLRCALPVVLSNQSSHTLYSYVMTTSVPPFSLYAVISIHLRSAIQKR